MTKNNFLQLLSNKLSALKKEDKAKYVSYYSEMIDDYIEDGMTEEQAVEQLETIDVIVQDILQNPIHKRKGLKIVSFCIIFVSSLLILVSSFVSLIGWLNFIVAIGRNTAMALLFLGIACVGIGITLFFISIICRQIQDSRNLFIQVEQLHE